MTDFLPRFERQSEGERRGIGRGAAPSSRSVPSSVVSVSPKGFGFATRVHRRIAAPPSGRLTDGPCSRISGAGRVLEPRRVDQLTQVLERRARANGQREAQQ